MIRRPEWHRSLDRELYLALRDQRLPGALVMNAAFTHAEGDLEVTVAYYAASQMLAFTAQQFGFPAITRALQLWGEGKATDVVFREAFGMPAQDYDAAFHQWELGRLARYQSQYVFDVRVVPLDDARAAAASRPRDASARVTYAMALLHEQKPEEASREIDAALEIDPNHKDAHFVAAKLAAISRDVDAEEKHLHSLQAAGGDGYDLAMSLAGVARERHDRAASRAALESAHRFDPTQPEPLRSLYDLAVDEKRDADALEALRALAPLDQHDRRAWHLLLQRLVAAKRWDEAKRVGASAIYVDVGSASTHIDYAKSLSATGDHGAAVFELESALLCDAKPEEKATAQSLLTQERASLANARSE
jgi:predicted Zn-dependent protease